MCQPFLRSPFEILHNITQMLFPYLIPVSSRGLRELRGGGGTKALMYFPDPTLSYIFLIFFISPKSPTQRQILWEVSACARQLPSGVKDAKVLLEKGQRYLAARHASLSTQGQVHLHMISGSLSRAGAELSLRVKCYSARHVE